MTAVVETFGASLRWWRTNRRYSQMQLANEAEVSSRHLSFLETGRASPSREMVIHLSHVLDLSLRDRNALLNAAGFAPVYPQSEMDAPAMDDVRQMLSRILHAHQPNPAAVIDRRGDLLDANEAALSLVAATVAPDSPALLPQVNVYRLALHPMGLRPSLTNWDAVAAALVGRLEREQAHRPADPALQAVVEEMLTYRDVAEFRARPAVPTGAELLVPLDLVLRDGRRLRLVSTIATVGAPFDVTLEELRLETFFAVDDDGRAVLEAGLS